MTTPLSAGTISIVRASVPALAEHGAAITTAMYKRLFQDEHIRALFNHANQGESGAQVQALTAAILGYARNIDNLSALAPVIERIAQKHIGSHILPEHYPFVANALLGALQDILADAATPELLEAWGEAYWFLANSLISREAVIRREIEGAPGGWHGWRRFRIAKKTAESSVITSFILCPEDGGPVLGHKAGQYLTFRFEVPGADPLKRNYSISSAPNGQTYRISVKREPQGAASTWLHDHLREGDLVEVTPPAGDFFLPEAPPRPVVLISGGVGLTPMVSMVEQITQHHPELEAHYVHGALNGDTHAMDAHVRQLAERHGRTSVTTFYSEPSVRDVEEMNHQVEGFITMDWLKEQLPLTTADIYLCGPKPFLRSLVAGLSLAGVPAERIHYEFFGPADELLAA